MLQYIYYKHICISILTDDSIPYINKSPYLTPSSLAIAMYV